MIFRCLVCLYLFWLAGYGMACAQPAKTSTGDTRIAFGSCNDQLKDQPLWEEIIRNKPDVWVWLGDNIYADTDDLQQMERYYRQQLQHPAYQKLLQTCPITGIWSDHDYAGDNADKYFSGKKESQQLFLDFIGIPKNDAVRKQEGIYRTYTLGQGNRKVKIILLDESYHRDPYKRLLRLYLPSYNGDVLGEAQWAWLEKELTNSDAHIHLIASGLQVLPNGIAYTNWSAFPGARNRLLQLLEKTRPAIPIIISGDRHVGELSKTDLKGYTYPLYEITSSGLTHFRDAKKAGNKYRIGEQVGRLNFGVLQIAWQPTYTSVTMQVRGEQNKLYLQQEVKFPVHLPQAPGKASSTNASGT